MTKLHQIRATAAALVIAIVISNPASAQTTECRTMGGVTRCTQEQSSQLNYGDAFSAGASLIPNIRRQQAENERIDADTRMQREEADAADAERRLRGRVGALIEAGDCASAISAALTAGAIDLARQVKDFCNQK